LQSRIVNLVLAITLVVFSVVALLPHGA
jgi:hypothetical protein